MSMIIERYYLLVIIPRVEIIYYMDSLQGGYQEHGKKKVHEVSIDSFDLTFT